MPGGADLGALYKNKPLILWVEDELTKLYLDALWQDPDVGFLIAGGWENIRAVVHGSRREARHVFGLRDRDFSDTNRSSWANEGVVVLVSESFEIENFLLDETALAGCALNTAGLDATTLLREMEQAAARLPWWMAARSTINWLRDTVLGDFVPHPAWTAVGDRTAALASILSSSWWTAAVPRLAPALQAGRVEEELDRAHARYDASLTNGTWKGDFSGKEIWRQVWRRLWAHNSTDGAELDTAKAVAAAQHEISRVPEELRELRSTLRGKVGLHP
ncbi:MAG: hypothetical protein ACYDCL_03340 [Myxococcales bacterium]